MIVEVDEERFGEVLAFMGSHLDEKQRRLLAGSLARLWGYGGVSGIARVSGMAANTVGSGARSFDAREEPTGRVRREGAGRPAMIDVDPDVLVNLDGLVEPESRGDPMSPLRWTLKSTRQLARALRGMGHEVSSWWVAQGLVMLGYSLQGNAKTIEGAQHRDRNAQFEYINRLAGERLGANEPVVSVDCKKKELVNGTKANAGRELRPKGRPERVDVHDFPDPTLPKAIPYGVFDTGANEGWMSVGDDHDTAAFAVNAIRRWWQTMGSQRYPTARRLMITADAGGSNSYRNRLWKSELAKLSAETGLEITVCHYPPGTSKWNKIEHRMFSFITTNWRGKPLTSYRTIVELVAATTTDTGLRILAEWDEGHYPKGIKISDEQLAALPLNGHDWHPDWNYNLKPPKQTTRK